jgi:DNA polymerase elongation subunit (family B)
MDCDVASMYPSIMIVNNLYPEHLDESFISILRDNIVNVRLLEKKKPKKEQNKVIVDGYKLAANATYG